MAKLYFRYGTVSSAKTLNLLSVVHNYERQGKKALLVKPSVDKRNGERRVRSRAGLSKEADLVLGTGADVLSDDLLVGVDCLVVDESQFLSKELVELLRDVATRLDVPVICYGLRSDFKTKLFPGSQRLFELADTIEEIKTTCHFCRRKSLFNLRIRNSLPEKEGNVIELGGDDLYLAVCHHHYENPGPIA